jgi:ubiquinone/menaquinone biosynthesis C-methylase UbiE
MLAKTGTAKGAAVCDVGAGVAHLTLMLADKGFQVKAVEPNDAMRFNGIKRTANYKNVTWSEGTGEETGQETGAFELVTFGSSFNVCDRAKALAETARILRPAGWFACMWNHRDLEDPIQSKIESIIAERVSGYSYGTRREDQTEIINESGLFGPVQYIEGSVSHTQTINDCIEAWRSHGTLQRQAGDQFAGVVDALAVYLKGLNTPTIEIPYLTRLWAAQKKA